MIGACMWDQNTAGNWFPLQIELIFFEWIYIYAVTKAACSRIISRFLANIRKIHNLNLRCWVIAFISRALFINLRRYSTVFILNKDSVRGWTHSNMLSFLAHIIAATFLDSSLSKKPRAFTLRIFIALNHWLAHALAIREATIENNNIWLLVTVIIICLPVSFWTLLKN